MQSELGYGCGEEGRRETGRSRARRTGRPSREEDFCSLDVTEEDLRCIPYVTDFAPTERGSGGPGPCLDDVLRQHRGARSGEGGKARARSQMRPEGSKAAKLRAFAVIVRVGMQTRLVPYHPPLAEA